jgi:hypothetical protein
LAPLVVETIRGQLPPDADPDAPVFHVLRPWPSSNVT